MRVFVSVLALGSSLALGLSSVASLAGETAAPARPAPATSDCVTPENGYPIGARPGQCFAQVRTPLRWETVTERVMVRPAHTETRVIPARTETVMRRVIDCPERVEHHRIPAVTRQVAETVVVRPATVRVETLPPVYDMVAEEVMLSPPRREWRTRYVGGGEMTADGQIAGPTGVVTCLVEYPAQYGVVQRQVLRQPARTIETPVPAVTRQVVRTEVIAPERDEEVRIPATWREVPETRVVEPERAETFEVPAVYETRSHQRVTGGGDLVWKEISCPQGHGPHRRPHPPHGSSSDGERG